MRSPVISRVLPKIPGPIVSTVYAPSENISVCSHLPLEISVFMTVISEKFLMQHHVCQGWYKNTNICISWLSSLYVQFKHSNAVGVFILFLCAFTYVYRNISHCMTNHFLQAHEYKLPRDKYFQLTNVADILNNCYSGNTLLYHHQQQQGENSYDSGMLNLLYF